MISECNDQLLSMFGWTICIDSDGLITFQSRDNDQDIASNEELRVFKDLSLSAHRPVDWDEVYDGMDTKRMCRYISDLRLCVLVEVEMSEILAISIEFESHV